MRSITQQAKLAYKASKKLAGFSGKIKNQALILMAKKIIENQEYILKENEKDLKLVVENKMEKALLDRLTLNAKRIKDIADSLYIVKDLEDPVGEIISGWVRPEGFKVSQIRVPLGVVGIIYEARPNVTADAIALCIKTGNAVVLRGSSSAYNSNKAISEVFQKALVEEGMPADAIQLLEDTSRENIKEFLTLNQYLSVIIPRGGAGLIKTVVENATVPTIETGVGNCHIYVDESADFKMAENIIINAKTQRPSVCNACETVLIHEKIADRFLPELVKKLQDKKVELRVCEKSIKIAPNCKLANEQDWATEYLDLILAIKIVPNIEAAIEHIDQYSTRHSEAIITNDLTASELFKAKIDASTVLVNASTRLVDGGIFGFGAEMGISTQKLHARGPMGLKELTTYKYLLEGKGNIRE